MHGVWRNSKYSWKSREISIYAALFHLSTCSQRLYAAIIRLNCVSLHKAIVFHPERTFSLCIVVYSFMHQKTKFSSIKEKFHKLIISRSAVCINKSVALDERGKFSTFRFSLILLKNTFIHLCGWKFASQQNGFSFPENEETFRESVGRPGNRWRKSNNKNIETI